MDETTNTPDQNERLEHAVATMLMVANINEMRIRTCFNGIEVVVEPGDEAEKIIAKYDADFAAK